MAKTNISMPDALLSEVDRRAKAARTTRSGFIQEAAAHYIATLEAKDEAAKRSERIARAIEDMAEIGQALPQGSLGVGLIRSQRDLPPSWLVLDDADE